MFSYSLPKHVMKAFFALYMLLLLLFIPLVSTAQWQELNNPGLQSGLGQNWLYNAPNLYNFSNTELRKSTDLAESFVTLEAPIRLSEGVIHNEVLYAWGSDYQLYVENTSSNTMEPIFDMEEYPFFGISYQDELLIMRNNSPLISSENGQSFSTIDFLSGRSYQGYGVINGELFVATVNNSNGAIQMAKYDGSNWSFVSNGPFDNQNYLNRMLEFDGKLFAQTSSNTFYESTDGEKWTQIMDDVIPPTRVTLLKSNDILLIYNIDRTVYRALGDSQFQNFQFNNGITRYRAGVGIGDQFYTAQGPDGWYAYDYASESWSKQIDRPQLGSMVAIYGNRIFSYNADNEVIAATMPDLNWEPIFSDPNANTEAVFDIFTLPSGRLIVVQQSRYFYSDDYENFTQVNAFTQDWLVKGDSVYYSYGNTLNLSTDEAETWTQVANFGGTNLRLYGDNAMMAGRRIYNLSDYSQEFSLFTNFGTPLAYDTLNGNQYLSTSRGLYVKPFDEGLNTSGWTFLNARFDQGTNRAIRDMFTFEEVLFVISNNGSLYYSTDDAATFSAANPQIFTTDHYIEQERIAAVSNAGYHILDLTQFGSDPTIQTIQETQLVRIDTMVHIDLQAQVLPKGQAVEVWFTYGRFTGSNPIELTERTESQFFEAADSAFIASQRLLNIGSDQVQNYSFRAHIRYGEEGKERVGDLGSFNSRYRQYWERITPASMTDNFRDLVFTHAGNIIAYTGSGYMVRSGDSGQSWEEIQAPAAVYSMIQADGDTLFAGSTSGSFMYSVDEGDTWTVTVSDSLPSTGASNSRVPQLGYDPINHIYYAIYGERERATNNATYLIRSRNAGDSWRVLATKFRKEEY